MVAVKAGSLINSYYCSGARVRIKFCTRSDRDATQWEGCSSHSLTVGRDPVCMDVKLADLQLKGAGAQLSLFRHVCAAGQSTKKVLGRAEGRKETIPPSHKMIIDVAASGICRSITIRVRLRTLV